MTQWIAVESDTKTVEDKTGAASFSFSVHRTPSPFGNGKEILVAQFTFRSDPLARSWGAFISPASKTEVDFAASTIKDVFTNWLGQFDFEDVASIHSRWVISSGEDGSLWEITDALANALGFFLPESLFYVEE